MNWLIILIILVLVIAIILKLWSFLRSDEIIYVKGSAGPLVQARVRSITINMGKNKRTKDEWKKVLQYGNVSDKIREWNIITDKNYDILFVSLQESWNESSQYGQMGQAICELLTDFNCYSYSYDGPPFKWPFSVQNLVFVKKGLVTGKPGVLKGKICHSGALLPGGKASLFCTKATVGLALEFANRRLVFLSSHLPLKSDKEDLGYSDRVESMKAGLKLLEKLDSKDASVFWAGDLNFRRNTMADGQVQDEQLSYLRTSANLTKYKDFNEMSLEFPPTCKLLELNKLKETLSVNDITARDLRYSSSRNESTKDILSKGSKAYNVEPKPGQIRTPSYCDRILSRNATPLKYYSWTDGNAVDNSDHNIVILEATV